MKINLNKKRFDIQYAFLIYWKDIDKLANPHNQIHVNINHCCTMFPAQISLV